MSAAMFLKLFSPGLILPIIEQYGLRSHFPQLYASSSSLPVEKALGAVILVNISWTTMVMLSLGMKVSQARTKCKEIAKKEDDKEAEERELAQYIHSFFPHLFFPCTHLNANRFLLPEALCRGL